MKVITFGVVILSFITMQSSVLAEENKAAQAAKLVRELCLTGGKSVEINADANGKITLRNPFKIGAEANVDFSRSELNGLVAALKFEGDQAGAQASQMRTCMQPYIGRILDAVLGTSSESSGSTWVFVQIESITITTNNHHCDDDCEGEPTRTGYQIQLAASPAPNNGQRLLKDPKLTCVSGPCGGWNQVTQSPFVDGSGVVAKASFDVWSKPTTWKLEAGYYVWK